MRSIRRILWGKSSHSYQVFKRTTKSDSTTKLVPIQWKDYLQSHEAAMGTKLAVAFANQEPINLIGSCANIFMAKIGKEILRQSTTKPMFWKRFTDDVISMWNASRDKIEDYLVKANSFHTTIKFTAEISETETTFLDTKVYKGDRFNKESILGVRTHFKATETFSTRISIRVTHQASRKASHKLSNDFRMLTEIW